MKLTTNCTLAFLEFGIQVVGTRIDLDSKVLCSHFSGLKKPNPSGLKVVLNICTQWGLNYASVANCSTTEKHYFLTFLKAHNTIYRTNHFSAKQVGQES
ncbi:hypothetical protein XENTR_v10003153 [Xenopus tropicalis]|nr:hypothetical protein XENTR_v10003153 [Xenopus tropicalis]